ncbi:MlaA family lipoprotein [Candidatus Sarmatiella mevalonica]|uniref:MlaA family lipoprotein n=1 Tax=Candidatus Sarmatiella mevalonica TaxID=2770581 RepID=UPI001924ED71|nr:VacJ family lipoprotein [Candidatus Sarmatiella mevalonica]
MLILCLCGFNEQEDYFIYKQQQDDMMPYNVQACPVYDPYETINRIFFKFNDNLDHFILRPIAAVYFFVTPGVAKSAITNAIDNINMPFTFISYLLQGNGRGMIESFWRFAINSSIGFAGLVDVATPFQLNPTRQNLSSTLAHYAVGPGPFLVVPFIGYTTARGFFDTVIYNNLFHPVNLVPNRIFNFTANTVKIINDRSIVLPFTTIIDRSSTDKYIAMRSAIIQRAEFMVRYPDGFICPK